MGIVSIKNLTDKDENVVGNRAVVFSTLARSHNTPEGFFITSEVFLYYLKKSGLMHKIENLLRVAHPDDPENIQMLANDIQKMIVHTPFPKDAEDAIIEAYHSLNINPDTSLNEMLSRTDDPPADIRSSIINDEDEDVFIANAKGADRVMSGILACYATHYVAKAITKRLKNNVSDKGVAVMVQRSVFPDISGVVYSHIKDGQKYMVIRSVFGINTDSVHAFSDLHVIDYESGSVLALDHQKQMFRITKDPKTNELQRIDLGEDIAGSAKLRDEDMSALVDYMKDVMLLVPEKYAIEFVVEDGTLSFVNLEIKDRFLQDDDARMMNLGTSDSPVGSISGLAAENNISGTSDAPYDTGGNSDNKAGSSADTNSDTGTGDEPDIFSMHKEIIEDSGASVPDHDPERASGDFFIGSDMTDSFAVQDSSKSDVSSHPVPHPDGETGSVQETGPVAGSTEISQPAIQDNGPSDNNVSYADAKSYASVSEKKDDALEGAKNSLGNSIVMCFVEINKKLRNASDALGIHATGFDDAVAAISERMTIPYLDEIKRIRELRNRYIESGQSPSIVEVKFVFENTEKFLDEFRVQ